MSFIKIISLSQRILKLKWYHYSFFLTLFLFQSFLDLIGLSLIGVFISLISQQTEFVEEYLIMLPIWLSQILLDPIWLSVILFSVFLGKTVFSILINFLIVRFGYSQQFKLRERLTKKFLYEDYLSFLSKKTSERIYSMSSLVNRFTDGILLTGLRVVSDILICIFVCIVFLFSGPEVLLIFLTIFGLAFLIYSTIFSPKMSKSGRFSNLSATSVVSYLQQMFRGIREVKLFDIDDYFLKKIMLHARNYGNAEASFIIISQLPKYFFEFLLVVFLASTVTFWIYFERDLADLLPILTIFAAGSIRLIPILFQLAASIMKINFGVDALSKIYDLLFNDDSSNLKLDRKEIDNEVQLFENDTEFKKLELIDINYKYPDTNTNVLSNLNMSLNSGDVIGIKGESGSGKSTLMNLMMGFLYPNSGEIRLNKKPFDSFSSLKKIVTYIGQDPFLIEESIEENILMFKKKDEKHFKNVLELTGFIEMLNKANLDLKFKINESATNLSGGQKQRIALARSLYHKRPLTILDEPTSSLDLDSEKEIARKILEIKGNITMVIISHRPKMLEICDRVFELKKGRLQ
ncbi:ATP-binding cassette domain-containing protein [SAR86 cluster bacterium]|nr:ATP-binding cassette domain-containing protein [SAR86 cluster bacterium]